MTSRIISVVIAGFLILALQNGFWGDNAGDFGGTPKSPARAPHLKAKPPSGDQPLVTRVIDGDTIVVLINGVSEKVRLIGVDTPETVDPRKTVQCFGKESSEFTKSLLLNTSIILEADSTQGNRDRYGRLLRYVFLEDGTLINEEIIALGYGHEYTYRLPYQYQTEFKNAERSARESQKGLWAPVVCENI
ncbi:MAG: thermonuclease family protein [Candidatus Yonathbacteria bacterium]|nr:thermonuclease family protein [Candidatus Yonathbacteria bacterium]